MVLQKLFWHLRVESGLCLLWFRFTVLCDWLKNFCKFLTSQAPVVQKLDSAIHRINLYPVDNAIGFPNTFPLDSDLSGG